MLMAYKSFWIRAFDFAGKTNRKDFIIIFFLNFLLSLTFLAILFFSLRFASYNQNELVFLQKEYKNFYKSILIFNYFYSIALIVPFLSLFIRRVRDSGKQWYLIFVNLIPIIGSLYFFVILFKPSSKFKKRDKIPKIDISKSKNPNQIIFGERTKKNKYRK